MSRTASPDSFRKVRRGEERGTDPQAMYRLNLDLKIDMSLKKRSPEQSRCLSVLIYLHKIIGTFIVIGSNSGMHLVHETYVCKSNHWGF